MPPDNEIEIRNLTIFPTEGKIKVDRRRIIDNFSLQVRHRTKVVITGPSGSGKTTVLKAILGFVPDYEGAISIRGKVLDSQSVWTLRRSLAYVPQELDLGDGTVRDVLMRPFNYRAAAPMRWDLKRAEHLFAAVHLKSALLDHHMSTLSGGEKQRVALVSALLLERPVLILDEFTSDLDRKSRASLIECLQQRRDITVLAASHDEAVWEQADEVIHL